MKIYDMGIIFSLSLSLSFIAFFIFSGERVKGKEGKRYENEFLGGVFSHTITTARIYKTVFLNPPRVETGSFGVGKLWIFYKHPLKLGGGNPGPSVLQR